MESKRTKTSGSWRRASRSGLLVLTVAAGTAALALSQLTAARLDRLLDAAVEGGGRRVVIANADLEADGSLDWQMPGVFSTDDAQAFVDAAAGIRAASVVNELPWRQIEVDGTAYRPGSVVGSDQAYAEVMGLRLVAGDFFPASDVAARSKVAVLSERAARALYGDSASAVGKTFRADRMMQVVRRVSGDRTARPESSYESYTVVGVFADQTAFERDAYDIPDYVVPYTAMFPEGMGFRPFARTFVARADSRDLARVEAGLRSSLAASGREGLKLAVWEGGLGRGGVSSVERVRSTLRSLSLIASLFGLAILAVAAFGIVSGMMAEAAERKREFGIKRALGLSAFGAVLELCEKGVRLAAAGAAVGFAAAAATGGMALDALAPFLDALGIAGSEIAGSGFEPRTVLAPIAAVVLAAAFSLLPALAFVREPIVDGLKE